MNTKKAIISFANYSATDLGPAAQHVHTKMTENAAIFTDPPVLLTVLLTLVTTYLQTLAARASRATADVIAFNDARDALVEALGKLGQYVNIKANGDAAIVEMSGFPSYDSVHAPDTSPPGAPRDVRLSHGDVSGSVILRCKTDRPGSANEVQVNSGDPNKESDWHPAGIFQGQKIVLTNLPPMTHLWVRLRTAGLKGVMGAWSDPAEISVI